VLEIGTVLRFTRKYGHAILVMLKDVPEPKYCNAEHLSTGCFFVAKARPNASERRPDYFTGRRFDFGEKTKSKHKWRLPA